ncbi:MAG: hypothetical protein B6I17_03580 [Tenericutes bacterium 4572_104]|nr:MAG: hypothetical protein B6I17_03580 [Tenericutes bacterium 4572_104]
MKIQILSDLHLEFEYQEFDFTEADILILAGDIHTGTKGIQWIKGYDLEIPVIYVMGNHEYYSHRYLNLLNECRKIVKDSNVYLLENQSITIDDITFHGTTMWTDFNLFGNPEISKFECEGHMNDYRIIKLDETYTRLRAEDTIKIFFTNN